MGRSEESKAKRRIAAARYQRANRGRVNAAQRARHAKNPEVKARHNACNLQKGKRRFAGGAQRATEKTCGQCQQEKPAVEFYLSNSNKDGLHGWCKPCSDRKTVDYMRKRMFGMTPEDFAALLVSQGGGCAICKTKNPGKRQFCVDHDHATGKVRGILCSGCNAVLGLAKDSIEVLKTAISYLEKKSEDQRG